MKKITQLLAVILIMSYITPASAHAISDQSTDLIAGLLHPFIGIDHLLTIIAVGLWAAHVGGSSLYRLPLVFIALMFFGSLVSVNGIKVPALEFLIASSVVSLGVLIFFNLKLPLYSSITIISFFAIIHGYSHGLELPQQSSALFYGSGFILATAILLIIGIILGRLTYGNALLSKLCGSTLALCGLYLTAVA